MAHRVMPGSGAHILIHQACLAYTTIAKYDNLGCDHSVSHGHHTSQKAMLGTYLQEDLLSGGGHGGGL
jgi:hypothetical protein